MVHLVLYGLLAVVLAGGLFLVASRFLPAGEQIAPSLRDEPPWELPPDRALHPDDVDSVRLPVALRGYRFAETDILLDRLAGELRARDREIARLRGHAPIMTAPPADPSPEQDAPPSEQEAPPEPESPWTPTPWAPDWTTGSRGEPIGPPPPGPTRELPNEPVVDEPVADEPVADEPVADEPVADDEPTGRNGRP